MGSPDGFNVITVIIRKAIPIVIYPREDSPIDEASLPPNVRLVHTPLINISSTDIRRRIREGRSIARLVPRAVADIILQEGLYR